MGKYDDIIHLPHKQSESRAHMSNRDRAAQFSPFAALSGHSEAMEETARLTDGRIVLSEYEAQLLNERLMELVENPKQTVRVTYFVPDEKKQGGRYVSEVKTVRAVNLAERAMLFEDRSEVSLDDIVGVEMTGKKKRISVNDLGRANGKACHSDFYPRALPCCHPAYMICSDLVCSKSGSVNAMYN